MLMRSWITALFGRLITRSLRKPSRRSRCRQVPTETLECRMLLSGTPITVNTTSDTANDANINGLTVSLREAINFANADTGHQDTITFASSLTDAGPATITLNGTELVITNSMTITGLGASQLTIDGNNVSRIFDLNGPTSFNVTITGLTLEHGNSVGPVLNQGNGGAIFNSETLTLASVVITGNTARYFGGGIWNEGMLTSYNNTISGNTAAYNGGGIFNGGTLISTNDTLSGNTATYFGGGIDNDYGGAVTLTHDTVAGNTANQGGAGVDNNGAVSLRNSIVIGNSLANSSQFSGSPVTDGGGNVTTGVLSNILETVAGNPLQPLLQNNGGAVPTIGLVAGSPAIGAGVALGHVTASGDNGSTLLVVDNVTYIAAGDYLSIGTEVVLVQRVTAGIGTTGTLSVQRHQFGTSQGTLNGLAIWLGADATGAVVTSYDSGARSSQHALIVNTTADPQSISTPLLPGTLTLRNAIAIANRDFVSSANPNGDTITFASSLTASGPATITLNGTELAITNSMTITGLGAGNLAIDGNKAGDYYQPTGSRIFNINGPATNLVTITGLTLQNAYTAGDGAAISNSAKLTLAYDTILGNVGHGSIFNSGTTNSTHNIISQNSYDWIGYYAGGGILNAGILISSYDKIVGNQSWNEIGGIYNSGTATLSYDIIDGNSNRANGAGVFNAGTLVAIYTSFTDNICAFSGGAIYNSGSAVLTHDTISGNQTTDGIGGGICNFGDLISTKNSITASIGGGIFNGGNLSSSDDDINGIASTRLGNGGGIYNQGTLTTLNDSISGYASGFGGGVYNEGIMTSTNDAFGGFAWAGGGIANAGSLVITNAQIGAGASRGGGLYNGGDMTSTYSQIGGSADGGGGIWNEGSLTSTNDNISGEAGQGGGIYNNGDLTTRNDIISGNAGGGAFGGGGIYNHGFMRSTNDQISGNSNSFGGGIFNDRTLITSHDTISGSTARIGGGIANIGYLTSTNDTISGNSASQSGGGIADIWGGESTISGDVIMGNTANEKGGGIYNDGTLHSSNNTITGNGAQQGGGIDNYGELDSSYDAITGNGASYWGGGIDNEGIATLTSDLISSNASHSGGGVYNLGMYYGAMLTLNRNTISNNTSAIGGGIYNGSILSSSQNTISGNIVDTPPFGNWADGIPGNWGAGIANSGSLTSTNDTISMNSNMNGDGGGVYNDGLFTSTNSTISNNSATNGAGIANASTMTSTGNTITENAAYANGGGIANSGDLTSSNDTISGNSGFFGGGGIWNLGAVSSGYDMITGNVSQFNGGGISNLGTLTSSNDTISDNSANFNGGGIWSMGTLDTTDDTITRNFAGFDGGGIGNMGFLTATNDTISRNHAGYEGGGIWNMGDLTSVANAMTGNTTELFDGGGIWNLGSLSSTNDTISGNTTPINGGGLYNAGGNVTVLNDTISGNTASNGGGVFNADYVTLTISNTSISENSANVGGGIFNDVSGVATLDHNMISRNSVSGNGGGINNEGNLSSFDDTISGNVAGKLGGGISNSQGAIVTLSSNLISKNSAHGGGGYYNIGAITSANSTITLNDSLSGGGGIYNYGSLISTDDIISANRALGTDGGGIFNGGSLTTLRDKIIDNWTGDGGGICTFGVFCSTDDLISGNTAWGGAGGGIWNAGGSVTTNHDRILGNTALNGGGVFNANVNSSQVGAVISTNDIVSGNTAGSTGGGIWNVGIFTATYDTIQSNTAGREGGGREGGGIENYGSMVSSNNTIIGNSAILNGGGINNRGSFTSTNDMITGNSASSYGGGITISGHSASSYGGGIDNFSNCILTNDTITGNTATYGGGIANFRNLTTTSNTISGNSASSRGGGIGNFSNCILTNDTITGNTAPYGGGIANFGNLTTTSNTISGNLSVGEMWRVWNSETLSGRGGGIYNQGTLSSLNDAITGNTASNWGGGIYNDGTATLMQDAISSNASHVGGGVYNGGTLTSNRNTISNNSGTGGGGIDNGGTLFSFQDTISANTVNHLDDGNWGGSVPGNWGAGISNNGTITLISDTIVGNTNVNGYGGGVYNDGLYTATNNTISNNSATYGGGIASTRTVIGTNNTIAGNSASSSGGGIYAGYGGGPYQGYELIVSLRNSIVLGNTAPSGSQLDGTNIVDGGGNITTGVLSSVLQTVPGNPLQPLLQNNGGPVQTIALVAGSPAIGAAVALAAVTASGDGGTTSLAVDNVTYLIAGDYLKIGTEVVLVQGITAGTGTTGTLTVLRHQMGTSQVSLNGLPIWLATDATGLLVNSHDSGARSSQHVLTVNSNLDNVNDSNLNGSTVTLREAINFANSQLGDRDTITFAPSLTASGPATITLNGTELVITNSLTITGSGANQLAIDGHNASRIFNLNGPTSVNVTITGLTLQHGKSVGSVLSGGNGGAIFNSVTLTLSQDVITGNSARYFGGGIWNQGNLNTVNDTISGNTSTYDGGGIFNGGNLTSSNDTIAGNTANYGAGGGVYNDYGGMAILTQDTIAGNTATYGGGGGIDNNSSVLLRNSIVIGNSAANGPQIGGSPIVDGGGNITTGQLSNVLQTVAGNPLQPLLQNNGGLVQTIALVAGSPAIGVAVTLGSVTATGDGGTSSLAVDNITYLVTGDYLKIGTEVVLVQGITAGTGTTGTLTVLRHQMGTSQVSLNGLPIWLATDATGLLVNSHDSGARSSQHVLTVNSNLDNVNDSNLNGSTVTLREAINFANSQLGDRDTITFAPSLTASGPATITLNGTELVITNSMTITGFGANQLAIDGHNSSRIFNLNGPTSVNVTITGLTLQHAYSWPNGNGVNQGGAIANSESLTLSNDVISGNTAGFGGGGIYNSGILTSTNNTLSGNSASYGGGISNDGTFLSMNDTFSGNFAGVNYSGLGGGIFTHGTLSLTNDTIAGNSSNYLGGGIFNYWGATFSSTNVTIAGNSAASTGGGIYNAGDPISLLNSIILGNSASSGSQLFGSLSADSGGNLTTGILSSVLQTVPGNPQQPWLQNNDGPTQTIALVPGSPAIGAGVALGHVNSTGDSGSTLLAVDNVTYVATGDYLRIGAEVVLVQSITAGAGTRGTLTVLRHQMGTSQGSLNGLPIVLALDQRGSTRSLNDLGAVEMNPPVITTQPMNVSVNAGRTANLLAIASGSPTPTIQWQVSLDQGASWTDVAGATSTSLSFMTTPSQNGFQFRANFNNRVGTATTNTVKLTVNTAPVVIAQSSNLTVNEGALATFTAQASGTPTPTVQWQSRPNSNAAWTPIVGATSTTYSFVAAATDTGKQFQAIFTNSVGSVVTTAAVLTVTQSTSAHVIGMGVKWGTSGTASLVDASGGSLLPNGRTVDIPWFNINRISITLDRSIASLSPADVSVTGVVGGNYGPVSVTGSGSTWTITLLKTIASADKVTVTIGNSQMTTYQRKLNVLPGDFNDDGNVTSADVTLINNAISGSYNLLADLNGDGLIDINDLKLVRGKIGSTLIL